MTTGPQISRSVLGGLVAIVATAIAIPLIVAVDGLRQRAGLPGPQ
jgi:hypothetical protein